MRSLIDAMSSPGLIKTYVALVRREVVMSGEKFMDRGWFTVDRPIKNDSGKLNNATTCIKFVAGQPYDEETYYPRSRVVLARPVTGRWHQVRRHLNGLSNPILGDTSHGSSTVNREWK